MSSAAAPSTIKRFVVASATPGPDAFRLESVPLPAAPLSEGQLRVKALWITVDPYLFGLLGGCVGHPMVSGQVAEVQESRSADYSPGDKVFFYGQWAEQQVISPTDEVPFTGLSLRKLDESVPLSYYLGALGMPGETAYFALFDAARFKQGDSVLVSGAAGAVGSLAGQLAKLHGAKLVIGTAGGPDKCALLTSKFGFDAAIDYKKFDTAEKVTAELKRISPEGVDVYVDNTGGHVAEVFYDVTRKRSRVAVVGALAHYAEMFGRAAPAEGAAAHAPAPFFKLIYNSVSVQGVLVNDYAGRWAEFQRAVTPLVRDGKVHVQETVAQGFEQLPQALDGLFTGKSTGKMIVKV